MSATGRPEREQAPKRGGAKGGLIKRENAQPRIAFQSMYAPSV